MSFSVYLVGAPGHYEALKRAVQRENAPPAVIEEVCHRIDQLAKFPSNALSAVVVKAWGHLDVPETPFRHSHVIQIEVQPFKFVTG